MTLIPVETPEDFLLAQQFIIPHEVTCVSLASLVRKKSDKLVFLVDSKDTVVEPVETTVLGLLNLDSTIYHCIPDISKVDAQVLKENLPFLMKKPVRCISGETSATDFLIEVFKQGHSDKLNRPAQIYPYKMLRWLSLSKLPQTSDQLSGGEEIFRCTEHDMDSLHPLQKDYMKDEVAVPGRLITDAEVSLTLRNILKNQLCFALLCDGEPVAKANTNAIGINCVQIGGVYTHPLYRRNGYAGVLVQALCKRAEHAHRTPVLFVKEKNMPAFNLYWKLGFEECGQYTIAYY